MTDTSCFEGTARPAIWRVARSLFFGALLAAPLATDAQSVSAIDIKTLTFLKSTGLQLKIPGGSSAMTLPAPSAQSPQGTAAADTRYSAYALWQHDQVEGVWRDSAGNLMIISRMDIAAPSDYKALITRGNYEKGLPQRKLPSWGQPDIQKWMAAFAQSKELPTATTLRGYRELKEVYEFDLHRPDFNVLAYAFRVNSSAGQLWYMAGFTFSNKHDLEATRKELRTQFLPSLDQGPVPNRNRNRQNLKGNTRTGAAAGADRFTDARQQAINSIRNMDKWWYINTRNYIVLSDFKDKKLAEKLEEELERLRTTYMRLMPPRAAMNQVGVVRVFSDAVEYAAYVPPQVATSIGVWVPGRKELIIRGAYWYGDRVAKETLMHTVYHEAFHQYMHYAYPGTDPHVWYSEGMAELCAGIEYDRLQMNVRELDYRVDPVLKLIKEDRVDFERLTTMTQQQFYTPGQTTPLENYALSWALVYFIEKGAEGASKARYTRILISYRNTLWSTKNAEAARNQAFRHVDMNALKKDFIEFWSSPERRKSADRRKGLNTMAN